MPRALESVSLILFQIYAIVVALISTNNSNSDGIGMLNKNVLSVNRNAHVPMYPRSQYIGYEVVTELLIELTVGNVEQSFDIAEREKDHAEL